MWVEEHWTPCTDTVIRSSRDQRLPVSALHSPCPLQLASWLYLSRRCTDSARVLCLSVSFKILSARASFRWPRTRVRTLDHSVPASTSAHLAGAWPTPSACWRARPVVPPRWTSALSAWRSRTWRSIPGPWRRHRHLIVATRCLTAVHQSVDLHLAILCTPCCCPGQCSTFSLIKFY